MALLKHRRVVVFTQPRELLFYLSDWSVIRRPEQTRADVYQVTQFCMHRCVYILAHQNCSSLNARGMTDEQDELKWQLFWTTTHGNVNLDEAVLAVCFDVSRYVSYVLNETLHYGSVLITHSSDFSVKLPVSMGSVKINAVYEQVFLEPAGSCRH